MMKTTIQDTLHLLYLRYLTKCTMIQREYFVTKILKFG